MDNNMYAQKESDYGIEPIPKDAVPAMAYVPYQISAESYTPEKGLMVGTLFPVLDKPFIVCGGTKNE